MRDRRPVVRLVDTKFRELHLHQRNQHTAVARVDSSQLRLLQQQDQRLINLRMLVQAHLTYCRPVWDRILDTLLLGRSTVHQVHRHNGV